jgi:excisionase family DNA binding protein
MLDRTELCAGTGAAIPPEKRCLSTEEVARLLGYSVRTITAWAVRAQSSGGSEGIPAFKLGRSWRFERRHVQTYIEKSRSC